jgi:regulator of cell morphogenesis and NO signaling
MEDTTMPDPVARERLKKRMLDRWENEGGSIATDTTSADATRPTGDDKGRGRKRSSPSEHHAFTREELVRLEALLAKVSGVHGQNHPELFQIQDQFGKLRGELEPHMLKEESVLFPYIVRMEEATLANKTLPPPPFRTVQNPVRVMMAEHDAAGYILGRIREATSDYAVPPDGCISYKTLYSALTALEVDLHQHIHLENNILFPRAVAMEDLSCSI